MKTWIRITNPYFEETYQVKESKGSIENSISNIERGNKEFIVLTQVLRINEPMFGKDVRMTINPKNFASFEFWEERNDD